MKRLKRAKMQFRKNANIDRRFYVDSKGGGGGGEQVCARPPPYKRVCKISRHWRAISSLVFNKYDFQTWKF